MREFFKTPAGMITGGVVLFLGFFVAIVGLMALQDGGKSVENVVVTNLTESAFTLTWTSEDPYVGQVAVKEEGESWTPLFGMMGVERHSDTRDVELNSDGELVEVEGGAQKRYTHHVSVTGLSPETSYSVRVAGKLNAIDFATEGEEGVSSTIKTKAINDDISTPLPAYGKVDGVNVDDSFVIISLIDSTKSDALLSGTISDQSTYSVDVNQFGVSSLKGKDMAVTVRSENGEPARAEFSNDRYQPFDTIKYTGTTNSTSLTSLDGLFFGSVSAHGTHTSPTQNDCNGKSCGNGGSCNPGEHFDGGWGCDCPGGNGSFAPRPGGGSCPAGGGSPAPAPGTPTTPAAPASAACNDGIAPGQSVPGACSGGVGRTYTATNGSGNCNQGTSNSPCMGVRVNCGACAGGSQPPATAPTTTPTLPQEGAPASNPSQPSGGGANIVTNAQVDSICEGHRSAAENHPGWDSGLRTREANRYSPGATCNGTRLATNTRGDYVCCQAPRTWEIHANISPQGQSPSSGVDPQSAPGFGERCDALTANTGHVEEEQTSLECDGGRLAFSEVVTEGGAATRNYRLCCTGPSPYANEINKPSVAGLSTPAIAQNTDDKLTVETSGNYAFFANGEKIAEGEVVVDGSAAYVKLFDDSNRNGVKDSTEGYIADYTQISISKNESIETFTLQAGWNLINFPLIDNRSSNKVETASDLIESWTNQGGNLRHVARFRNGKFEMFTKREDGSTFSNDFNLIPGEAYFVLNLTPNAQVNFTGNEIQSSVPVKLNNGWNLVGIPVPASQNSEQILDKAAAQGFTADTISTYESGLYSSVVKENSTLFGNNFNIVNKKGYFLRVKDGGGADKQFTP